MKLKAQEILDKLPTSWEEVSVEKYCLLANLDYSVDTSDVEDDSEEMSERVEKIYTQLLRTTSILADVDYAELCSMEYTVLPVGKINEKLSFMNIPPKPNKSSKIKFKSAKEVTYGDYIMFIKFSHDFINNLDVLIPEFMKMKKGEEKMTSEDVMKMNVVEITTAFFLHRKRLMKWVMLMTFFNLIKLLKQRIQMRCKTILFKQK